MQDQNTPEDRAWFNQPVNVEVEQDNSRWLDEMLKMKQDELVNYAVFQYGIPAQAAEVVNRNDLISMIVVANKAGGGASVSRQSYRYLSGLRKADGILVVEPGISTIRGERPLFLTRGEGANLEVYDKVNDEWKAYELLKQSNSDVSTAKKAADDAAATESTGTSSPEPSEPTVPLDMMMPMVPKMNRSQLEQFAAQLNITDANDPVKYPAARDIVEAINNAYEALTAQKGGEEQ